jgi:four helix bundle protein
MNESEVIMHDEKPTSEFIAHTRALRAAAIAINLASRLPSAYRSLADQVIRSASSVPANLAEGLGRSGKDRAYHWRVAYGSSREIDTHLALLSGVGAIDQRMASVSRELFDEVRAMTWTLLHPKP